jgi:hypothetical protein
MVYVYYGKSLQRRSFRVVHKGVLGLGLIMVHVYYECALQGRSFRVA